MEGLMHSTVICQHLRMRTGPLFHPLCVWSWTGPSRTEITGSRHALPCHRHTHTVSSNRNGKRVCKIAICVRPDTKLKHLLVTSATSTNSVQEWMEEPSFILADRSQVWPWASYLSLLSFQSLIYTMKFWFPNLQGPTQTATSE